MNSKKTRKNSKQKVGQKMERAKDGKKFLTIEEATALLPDCETIHTFYSTGICLVGGDWDRADVLQKLVEVDKIELAGDSARSMGHGLAVYKDGAKLIDVLFIETDKDKIDAFDPLEEQEKEVLEDGQK